LIRVITDVAVVAHVAFDNWFFDVDCDGPLESTSFDAELIDFVVQHLEWMIVDIAAALTAVGFDLERVRHKVPNFAGAMPSVALLLQEKK